MRISERTICAKLTSPDPDPQRTIRRLAARLIHSLQSGQDRGLLGVGDRIRAHCGRLGSCELSDLIPGDLTDLIKYLRRQHGEARVNGPRSYRALHQSVGVVERYEHAFGPDTYATWLWAFEQRCILELIERYLGDVDIRYLDFACGTGRIISLLESRVAKSTGIDISESMLDRAAERLTQSALIHGDATVDPALLTGPFDLVTSFRFFLNAEDRLRMQALRVIHNILSDRGLLVFNVHGNKTSIRSCGILFRKYLLRQPGRNQLSYREVKMKLWREGFEILEVHGFGLLSARLSRLIGKNASNKIETLVRYIPFLKYVCVDLVFACRKIESALHSRSERHVGDEESAARNGGSASIAQSAA